MIFITREKAYDRVPREILGFSRTKKYLNYVEVINDTYDSMRELLPT